MGNLHFAVNNKTRAASVTLRPNAASTVLTGCTKTPIGVLLLGQTKQQSALPGKNRFDFRAQPYYGVKLSYEILENGLLLTPASDGAGATKYLQFQQPVCLLPDTVYTISMDANFTGGAQYRLYDREKAPITPYVTTKSRSFTTGQTGEIYLSLYLPNMAGAEQTFLFERIQIEEGTLATGYAPFLPDSPSAARPAAVISAVNAGVSINGAKTATEVTLRAVGETADSYDLETGLYTQRISPLLDHCTTERIDEVGARYILPAPKTVLLSSKALYCREREGALSAASDSAVLPVLGEVRYRRMQ